MRLFLFIASFGFIAACGDRSPEDVERDRVAQEAREFRKVEGVYEGELFSDIDGASLGDLSLSIEVKTKVTSESGVSTGQRLSLAGQILLKRDELFSAEFDTGFFNPSSGEVDISFVLTRPNGDQIEFKLSGFVEDAEFKGRLGAIRFSERSASFDLKRTQADARALPLVGEDQALLPDSKLAEWRAVYENKSVYLTYFKPIDDIQENFIQNFVPTRLFDVVVDFFGDVQIVFSNSILDLRTGLLKGEYSSNSMGSELVIYLECRGLPGQVLRPELKCRYTNLNIGRLIDLHFKEFQD